MGTAGKHCDAARRQRDLGGGDFRIQDLAVRDGFGALDGVSGNQDRTSADRDHTWQRPDATGKTEVISSCLPLSIRPGGNCRDSPASRVSRRYEHRLARIGRHGGDPTRTMLTPIHSHARPSYETSSWREKARIRPFDVRLIPALPTLPAWHDVLHLSVQEFQEFDVMVLRGCTV